MSNVQIVSLPVEGVVEARVLRDGRLRLVLEVRQPSGRLMPLTVEGDGRVPFAVDGDGQAINTTVMLEVVPRVAEYPVTVEKRPRLRAVA